MISVVAMASMIPSASESVLGNCERNPPVLCRLCISSFCMSGECALRSRASALSHMPSCAWVRVSNMLAAMVRVLMSVVFIIKYNI